MIELEWRDGLACPRIFCDECGLEIQSIAQGAAVFSNFQEEGTRSAILFAHKNHASPGCMRAIEERISKNGSDPGWVELRTAIADLASNIGFNAKDLHSKRVED